MNNIWKALLLLIIALIIFYSVISTLFGLTFGLYLLFLIPIVILLIISSRQISESIEKEKIENRKKLSIIENDKGEDTLDETIEIESKKKEDKEIHENVEKESRIKEIDLIYYSIMGVLTSRFQLTSLFVSYSLNNKISIKSNDNIIISITEFSKESFEIGLFSHNKSLNIIINHPEEILSYNNLIEFVFDKY